MRYKNFRRVFKRVAQKAEQLFYKEKFDARSNSIKQLWTNLNTLFSFSNSKKRQNKPHISKITVNNNTFTDTFDICNVFNSHFCNVGPKLAASIPSCKNGYMKYCDAPLLNSMYCCPVTEREVLKIVSCLKNKSPGHDNIGSKLLKLIINEIVDVLVHIFNLSFSSGIVPPALKLAKVIPIHKKGATDQPGNYRPISLLSIFEKIMEKLMHYRLSKFLSSQNILYKYQYGFRSHYSTSLALIELTDNLYFHLDQREALAGIYLDLQKAFDTVDHDILLYKLSNYGVRGHVLDWFRSYLTDRQQFVSIRNVHSNAGKLCCGVPQGSVLGPLLFLVYINDIQNCVPGTSIKLFADDTNIFISSPTVDLVYIQANDVLSKLSDWFAENKLSLSIDKTCYSIFSKLDSDSNSHHSVNIDGFGIQRVSNTRYLGVIIDKTLSWKDHIDYVYKKLLKFVGIFYKLRYKLNSSVLRMLYFALVHPHLLYGIEVYANTYQCNLTRLVVLNNKILRILQNEGIRTRVVNLYRNYHTLPVPLLHTYQVLIFVHKFVHHKSLLPDIFHDYFTENKFIHSHFTRSADCLHLQNVRTSVGARCLKFKGSQLWNDLPGKLRDITSVSLFKSELKVYLLYKHCDTEC